MHNKIFPKYPEIASQMKLDALMRYRKYLKTPLRDHMEREIKKENRKSINKVVEFIDKDEYNKKNNLD
jgi:hypothetical protein